MSRVAAEPFQHHLEMLVEMILTLEALVDAFDPEQHLVVSGMNSKIRCTLDGLV